ncbi:hybrid sensor histidine kinase/response regulator [Vibrio owensii]|uniref:hybrid sensor histidine kinase/response regulator n=1 Tax=Vibrio owensii TaxID=696485 RepID=UPI000597D137|nr:PAS domain-containing hybrid sensor histidine kinase/response regulator [Vibrio owensii]
MQFFTSLIKPKKTQFDFFTNSHCALLVCKNDCHSTIIEANDAFYDLVGYSRKEFKNSLNNQFASIVIDDLSVILDQVLEAVKSNASLDYEYRIRTKQGEILWIHDIANYNKELDCFYVAIMNITYRQNALDSILKTTGIDHITQWLSSLINHIPDPITIYDPMGKRIFSNEAFYVLKNNAFNGNQWNAEEFEQKLVRLAQQKNEDQLLIKIGTQTFSSQRKEIIHPFEKQAYTMLMLNDVTQLREKQRELTNAMSARDHFLAVISHELRTPISAMMGLMKLLREDLITSEHHAILDNALRSANRLNLHVNSILDFSKIQANQFELDIQKINIWSELQNLLLSYQPLCQQKNIGLLIEWEECAHDFVYLDGLRVCQIVENIMSNAIKFTANGSIKAKLSVGAELLEIIVCDSGCGMTSEQLANLYSPFTQGDKSISRRFGGTGLGLSIVKGLVELMSGELSINSVPQVGTVVRLSLPYQHIRQDIAPSSLMEPRDKKAELSSIVSLKEVASDKQIAHVLVIDDDVINGQLFMLQLSRLNITTTYISDPKAVIGFLESNTSRIDLVISDIHMPELNGYQLAKQIKANDRFKSLPILACTADNAKNVVEKAKQAGMLDVIYKPYNIESLFEKICKIIDI